MAKYQLSSATEKYLSDVRPMFLGGAWKKGSAGETIDCVSPIDGEVFAKVASASKEDALSAISAARESFDGGVWKSKTPAARAKILWRLADLIEKHTDTLAELEVLDGGKLHSAAKNGEVPMAAESFRYYAGWITKLEGKTTTISSAGGAPFHCYTEHEPVGVAGMILPWNGPLVMAAWKLAPALAAGCSCVVKPAELTCLSTLFLGELMQEAGIPDGVVNIVTGSGRVVGAAIAESPLVDKLSFTGSTHTGKSLLDAAKGNLKKLTLELGGKSPAIVLDDCDIDKTVAGVAAGIFSGAGQVCVAGSRAYVARSIYPAFLEKLKQHVLGIKVGEGFDPDSQMGPLISETQLSSVLNFVRGAVKEGAVVATGGERLRRDGYYMTPAVIVDADDSMQICREEVFGPVLVVQPFDDLEEVIRRANDSEYGLAASVWTENVGKAHGVIKQLQAGITWVNCHGLPDMAMPFGGFKQSGWGREAGLEGLMQYCETRSTLVNLG